MPQSLSRILVHLVFSTKNREPFITAEHRERLFTYLGGTLNNIDCPVIAVGVADHVHILFSVSPSKVREIVRYIANQERHHRLKSFQDEFRQMLRDHGIEWDEQ